MEGLAPKQPNWPQEALCSVCEPRVRRQPPPGDAEPERGQLRLGCGARPPFVEKRPFIKCTGSIPGDKLCGGESRVDGAHRESSGRAPEDHRTNRRWRKGGTIMGVWRENQHKLPGTQASDARQRPGRHQEGGRGPRGSSQGALGSELPLRGSLAPVGSLGWG